MENKFNPFPGIRHFESRDSAYFFGRETQIRELQVKLKEHNFVAVVGYSGSGKSSLVRAGLIPRLLDSGWRVATFRPENTPVANLARELNDEAVLGNYLDQEYTKINLDYSAGGVVETVRYSGYAGKLLIVVDQFEEIFRFQNEYEQSTDRDEAVRFVNLIMTAACESHGQIAVIINMRSEFIGSCSEFKGLPELINEGQFLMPRLTRSQYKDAIMLPLKMQGVGISASLVSRLLNDISNDPDQLPVLQHAMMLTFVEWLKEGDETKEIDISHYDRVGGMEDAIDRHCELIFHEIVEAGFENEVRIVFQRLGDVNAKGVKIRRPTKASELLQVSGSQEGLATILNAFRAEGRNFLLPLADKILYLETMIDMTHECIMRKWKRLTEWMKQENDNRIILQRLMDYYEHYLGTKELLTNRTLLGNFLGWSYFKQYKADKALGQQRVTYWALRYTSQVDQAIDFILESKRKVDAEKKLKRWIISTSMAAIFCVLGILLYDQYLKVKSAGTKATDELDYLKKYSKDASTLASLKLKNDCLIHINKALITLPNDRVELKKVAGKAEFNLMHVQNELTKARDSLKLKGEQITILQSQRNALKAELSKTALAHSALAKELESQKVTIDHEKYLKDSLLMKELIRNPELVSKIKEHYDVLANNNVDPITLDYLSRYIQDIDSIRALSLSVFDKTYNIFVVSIDRVSYLKIVELLHRQGYNGKIERSTKRVDFDRDGSYFIAGKDDSFNLALHGVLEKSGQFKPKASITFNAKPVNFDLKPSEKAAYLIFDSK